jgi:hypothetical protein
MAFNRIIEVISQPDGGSSISVTGLRIRFNIERNKTSTPNKANIDIYNLSDDTANKMAKSKNKIILKAGYADEGGLFSLFYGTLNNSVITKDGTEKILQIEAHDGLKNIQQKNANLSYSGGTRASVILDDILNILAYPLGGKKPTLNEVYSGGFAFIGKAKDALTQVLKRFGYKWTIQNEQIIIYKDGESPIPAGLLLKKDTGLLSIAKLEDVADKKTVGKYIATSLLFPQLVPGAQIKVESTLVSGAMFVESVKAVGDNFDGDFQMESEVRAV